MDIPIAFDFAAKTLALLVLWLALGSWRLSGKFNTLPRGNSGWFHWQDSSSSGCNLGWAMGLSRRLPLLAFSSSSPPMRSFFDIVGNPRVHL